MFNFLKMTDICTQHLFYSRTFQNTPGRQWFRVQELFLSTFSFTVHIKTNSDRDPIINERQFLIIVPVEEVIIFIRIF